MNQAESTSNSATPAPAEQRPDGSAERATGVSGDPTPSLFGRFGVFSAIAIIGGALDLWSKEFIFGWRGLPTQSEIWWIWEPYFGIETAVNIGAVFGLGAGQGPLFAAMSVVAAVGIIVWLFWFRAAVSLWLTIALGMVGGGIIGNLYDRLGLWWQQGYPDEWRSGVRDWILWRINEQWTWPNFNIADSLLVVGAGMLLYQSFFPGQFAAADGETAEGEKNDPIATQSD